MSLKRTGPPKRRTPMRRSRLRAANPTKAAKDREWSRTVLEQPINRRCRWPGCQAPSQVAHHVCQRSTHPHRRHDPCVGAGMCAPHHDLVHTAVGEELERVRAMGLLYRRFEHGPPCTCTGRNR